MEPVYYWLAIAISYVSGATGGLSEDRPGEILTYRNPGLGWKFGVAPLGGKWNMADYFYSPRPIARLALRTGDKRFGGVVQQSKLSALRTC